MNITVVGTGYVGLVAGVCFAETGNDVVCVDVNEEKIKTLRQGEVPIYEPGLSDLLHANLKRERISFTTSIKDGVESAEVIFIAVGTPQGEDGSADLRYVLAVAESIGKNMNGPKVIVDKSTVPVGTAKLVTEEVQKHTDHPFEVVSNPEFLKEGAAIEDFLKPDRVIVGVKTDEAAEIMKELYAPFVRTNNPILVMSVESAEMAKYAANAMLATRISFMNEIARLCDEVGADINSVRVGIGTDSRIGMSFLFPGIGYGGSCFPKDVQALIRTGKEHGLDLKISEAVEEVNREQKHVLVDKIDDHFGRDGIQGMHFAIWGLAFKPKTDDVREAPAQVICNALLDRGARLSVYDPEANSTFKVEFPRSGELDFKESNYDTLNEADALVICTEWGEFQHPNFERIKELMASPTVFDGRNIFDPDRMRELGFTYRCIGRDRMFNPELT